jgi:hypothetical protein
MGSSQKQDSQPSRPHVSGSHVLIIVWLLLGVGFWACVKEHLSKSELERFNTLEHITTDAGRGNGVVML